jgi:hypothetical protein
LTTKKEQTPGAIETAKARLVALGNMVTSVFRRVFAPTTHEKSLKLLFTLAMILGLGLSAVDIKGAFLYAEMPADQPTYIRLPKHVCDGHLPKYWKLNKTLYGLPESPRAFYEDASVFLLEKGYTRTLADPCMFYRRDDRGFIMMVVHVDDFAIASSTQELSDELYSTMKQRYKIKVKPSMDSFLGMHLSGGQIHLSQPVKIDELTQEHGLPPDGVYPSVPVPMDSKFSDEYQNDAPLVDVLRFMHLLGQLIYLVKTRPDMTYAINRMATRSSAPTERDYKALLQILWYLAGTIELGIIFCPI